MKYTISFLCGFLGLKLALLCSTFDILEGDARVLTHAAEDTIGVDEELRGSVELGDLALVEHAYTVVRDNRS